MADHRLHVALFLPSLRGGGVERVFINLSRGLADLDQQVDLVTTSLGGAYLGDIDSRVRLVDLGFRRIAGALPGLSRYLRQEKPQAVLGAMTHANCVLLAARMLSRTTMPVIVSEHHYFSREFSRGWLSKERLVMALAGMFYPHADGVTAVSGAAAADLAEAIRLPRERILTIHNPVDLERIHRLNVEPPDHPWFAAGAPPVILGAGRLTWEKDFTTLIRAFRLVQAERPARLVILGEGPDRSSLEALVADLGLSGMVSLPGFVTNPYVFMNRCSVFAMSSVTEGLPVALIEALACGASVVSTDCPTGPAEILAGGSFGALVPVGDVERLAAALLQALDHPGGRKDRRERAADFALEKISREYLDLMQRLIHGTGGERA